MTANLGPYPEYKESGLPWLGKVPAHWNCLPHRAIFNEIKEQGHVDEPLLSVTIAKGVIRQSDLLANSSKKDSSNLDKSKYKLLEPGDIAYNKMRAWQSAVGVSRHRGIVSPAYIVVRLRSADNPDYFHFLFRTPGFAKEAERWSYGITSDMWSLRHEHFKLIYSCVPSRSEQDAIVGFLRGFDAKVRRFIRNRRRLIEVLNEQKQSIVNRAVTLGLDPNVRLKSSGIEWLGEIPDHWDVRRVKQVCRFAYGDSLPEILRKDGEVPVFGSNGQVGFHSDPNTRCPCVVIGRKGSFGKVNYSSGPVFAIDTTYFMDERFTNANLRWLFYVLTWARLDAVTKGSAIPGLDRNEAYAELIPLCSESEQSAIAAHLDERLAGVERVINMATREIDLICEYRTRLITDVVNGKLDVRHLDTDIEEELAEPGNLDEDIDDEELLGDEEPELDEESGE